MKVRKKSVINRRYKMIIVKLTILAILITVVYVWLFRAWLRTNPEEVLKTALTVGYLPKCGYPIILLIIIDIVGVFASVIYLLFFR